MQVSTIFEIGDLLVTGFAAAPLQRLIGHCRVRSAVGAAGFSACAAEMKIRCARVADRPFAGMLGQMKHAGALFGAQNRLRHDLILNLVQIGLAQTRLTRADIGG